MVQIVDASVAIKWFVQEPGRETALDVLRGILSQPQKYAVPELFYFELVHVFNRLIPKPSPDQILLLKQVFYLNITRFVMTDEMSRHVSHFQALGLSGYDAAYLSLAKMLKGAWLSFDRKAHEKVAHLKLSRLLR